MTVMVGPSQVDKLRAFGQDLGAGASPIKSRANLDSLLTRRSHAWLYLLSYMPNGSHATFRTYAYAPHSQGTS